MEPNERIYRAIQKVPEGTVATYGQIADLVEVGPRQVGRALSQLPEDVECPWHRIVNSQGRISPRSGSSEGELCQQRLLEAEGIEFHNGKIDLQVYRWESEATADRGR